MMTQCLKCSDGNGSFFQLENTKVAGYCQQCFSKMIRQKFAFCLGRNRVFKDEQKREALIVCYSNNVASLQLLRLVHEATTDQNVHKRLRLNIQVLYLSDAISLTIVNQDVENCHLLSRDFPVDWIWHFAHESDILNKEFGRKDKKLDISIQHYNELFASCQSNSVRNELKQLFRVKLICRLSEAEFHCLTVLVPDTADKLAKDVLNALCFGRVASLSQMASMLDNRFEPVQIIRPFRDISYRELEAMNFIEKDELDKSTFTYNVENGADESKDSLQSLTADFILELRGGGFPATVSTILSVSTKIDNKTTGRKCILCYDLFEKDEGGSAIFGSQTICKICIQLIANSEPEKHNFESILTM